MYCAGFKAFFGERTALPNGFIPAPVDAGKGMMMAKSFRNLPRWFDFDDASSEVVSISGTVRVSSVKRLVGATLDLADDAEEYDDEDDEEEDDGEEERVCVEAFDEEEEEE